MNKDCPSKRTSEEGTTVSKNVDPAKQSDPEDFLDFFSPHPLWKNTITSQDIDLCIIIDVSPGVPVVSH